MNAFTGPIAASFDPYLQFSRDGIAVEMGQFHIDPIQSAEYQGVKKGVYSPIRVEFKSTVTGDLGGRPAVMVEGETRNLPVDVSRAFGSGHNVYVYFGSGQIENIHSSTALVDRALPKWLQQKVRNDIGAAIDFYSRNLGPRPPLRINFLVTWEPEADLSVISQATVGGSVMDGGDVRTIDLVVYKKMLKKSDADLLRHFQMVIFHELAHFWNRTETQDFRPVGWMIEGGADAITYRALRDLKRMTADEFETVVKKKTAHCRDGYRAPIVLADLKPNDDYYLAYACGFFVSVYSEKLLVDKNYFGFLRELFSRRDRQGGKYTIDDYFSVLRERSLMSEDLQTLRRWIEAPGSDRETVFK